MAPDSFSFFARYAAEEVWAFLTMRKAAKPKKDPDNKRHASPFRPVHKRARFRFLDLPAELRIQIYLELLTLQNIGPYNRAVCWPEILATCKQIHHEAGDMLYANSTIGITMRGGLKEKVWRGRAYYFPCCKVYVTGSERRLVFNDLLHLRRYFKRLLHAHVCRAYHLRLNINIAYEANFRIYNEPENIYPPTARMVEYLCQTLARNNRIRSFEVNVEVDKPHLAYSAWGLGTVLSPLVKIGKPEVFTFNGIPDYMKQGLYDLFHHYDTPPGLIQ